MYFDYSGVRVHFKAEGEGPALLLLHGWGGNADSFLPVLRDFSDANRVIAPDFPGHGDSDEPKGVWKVADFADCIAALMEKLGIESYSICAHSFGGRVALALAAAHPERVEKLVLTGCAGLRKDGGKDRGIAGAIKRAAGKSPLLKKGSFLREAAVSVLGSRDYKALTPSMRDTFSAVVSEDLGCLLPAVRCPTVLIWGTEDTETPIWMGERMEKEIGDAALIRLEGGSHFAYLEQYPKFRAVVKSFIGG